MAYLQNFPERIRNSGSLRGVEGIRGSLDNKLVSRGSLRTLEGERTFKGCDEDIAVD